MEAFFSIEVPSSQMTLTYVDQNKTRTTKTNKLGYLGYHTILATDVFVFSFVLVLWGFFGGCVVFFKHLSSARQP